MITGYYAGTLGILFFLLTLRTISLRRSLKFALGDGDNPKLQRAIRAHGNCAEYVPMCLVLMALLELSGSKGWFLHAMGGLLVAGRVLHCYGVSQTKETFTFRVSGMAMTLTVLMSCATRLVFPH